MTIYPHLDTGTPSSISFLLFVCDYPDEKRTALSMQSKLSMCAFVLAMCSILTIRKCSVMELKCAQTTLGFPGNLHVHVL